MYAHVWTVECGAAHGRGDVRTGDGRAIGKKSPPIQHLLGGISAHITSEVKQPVTQRTPPPSSVYSPAAL